ncbi:MAG: hypothetical protein CL489_10425 [Acidobacteria bacterium]|nr:hypothetical protein [Acidobacteriota bacterium]|tara:strand:+ start:20881 stop:21132 length:252 start_codon:yes stop_codon:yes gene_type:complete
MQRTRLCKESWHTGIMVASFYTDWANGWDKNALELYHFLFNEVRPIEADLRIDTKDCTIWIYGKRAIKNIDNDILIFYKNVEG